MVIRGGGQERQFPRGWAKGVRERGFACPEGKDPLPRDSPQHLPLVAVASRGVQ